MWPFRKKKILVTHSGNFHADDVFAAAALSILLKDRVKIIRTRDEAKIAKGDFVFDVGGVSDPAKNRFDHHQKGGAGVRINSIPYASFGLVWERYGSEITGSKSVADFIDYKLAMPIDAGDNGVSVATPNFAGIYPYELYEALDAFVPMSKEKSIDIDKVFLEMVGFAKNILRREIAKEKSRDEAVAVVKTIVDNSLDKRLIIFDKKYPIEGVINRFPEPLFVVVPRQTDWLVLTVRDDLRSFKNRKDLPKAWAGLQGGDLAKITGVPDAAFCHNNLFIAVAKSREGAIALARLALAA